MALLIAGVILFIRHKQAGKAGSEVLSEKQRSILEDFEAQVLALLSQHGGQLSQVQIAASLGLPSDRIAENCMKWSAMG